MLLGKIFLGCPGTDAQLVICTGQQRLDSYPANNHLLTPPLPMPPTSCFL
jgi:hypothetical protein